MSSGPRVKAARSMSFLSPKRRKTTGNLKAAGANGQGAAVVNGAHEAPELLPPPSLSPSLGSPIKERPGIAPRTNSQPVGSSGSSSGVNGVNGVSGVAGLGGDGNLFYAYARKADDLKSRFLLTFASATVANEWWLHLQTNFPDTSRPGPQLFSFKTDDLLAKAWRHPSFAHLKSKWMYISFSDAPESGIGGAAQGIIPVQDAEGNMLGGSAPASPESAVREIKGVRNEVGRLEEHFEKMMRVVERNTERVVELTEKQQRARSASDVVSSIHMDSDAGSSTRESFDMGVLSGHFVRMNELLSRNTQHVEQLTKKHQENERRLRETMEALDARQRGEGLDMERLSSHLDRIQNLMEKSVLERKDSAREVAQQPREPLQVDFSPLLERLEKVQSAVEQNSALVKSLLHTEDSTQGPTPFWGNQEATQPDLTPLTMHLERIHGAVEQQSEHMRTLVGYAGGENAGDGEGSGGGVVPPAASLAPLAEHLEQIYNAIEEGNSLAKGRKEADFENVEERLTEIRNTIEEGNAVLREREDPDFTFLGEHFSSIREQHQQGNKNLKLLLKAQNATRDAIEANGGDIDFTPLAELLDAIRESTESNAGVIQQLLESQEATRKETAVDLTPLIDHLQAMRDATERNTEHVRSMIQPPSDKEAPTIDLTPLTDRLQRIHSTLQKQSKAQQQLSTDNSPGTGAPTFLISALTSHLSKIQAVTEQNATHIKTLRDSHSNTTATDEKMHDAVISTSESVRSLVGRQEENEARIEAGKAQMREVMSAQRQMVEVLRELARSLVRVGEGRCDHVVVPPPRKMGRKVVGFVYDAKEGG